MADYVYQALSARDTIRIIGLQPSEESSNIRITLRDYPVSSSPEFEALSYVWGTGVRDHVIECEGWGLAVTSNVFSALQELRLPAEVRYVWVDAICINQDDAQERSYQVTLMRNIYTTAVGVIIWLGPSQPSTRQAWEAMRSIDQYERFLLDKRRKRKRPIVERPLLGQKVRLEIARLLSSSWFTRSWVVQEATCAKRLTLRCGSLEMDWATIRMTCYFIREQRDPWGIPIDIHNANNMVLLLEALEPQQGSKVSLEKLLPSTRHLKATDPRDKVYAFLGLSHGTTDEQGVLDITERGGWSDDMARLICGGKANIIPDYTIDVGLLYCVTAKRIMHETSTLSMLCHVQRRSTPNLLPSWVPDWRQPATIRILGETRPGKRPLYNTPQWTSSDLFLDLSTYLKTLKVYGFCLDTIEEVRADIWLADVYKPDQGLWTETDVTSFLKGMHDFMSVSLITRARSDPSTRLGNLATAMQDVITWGTQPFALMWIKHWLIRQYLDLQTAGLSLNLDDFKPGHPVWHYFMDKPPPDIFRGAYHAVQQYIPPYNDISGPRISAEHMALASKIRVGRSLFRTSRLGRVGLCPEWAQPGDMVCYLRGGSMPMVLRPQGKDFTVIGECYVHERMFETFLGGEKIYPFTIV
ncbi:hypothetical protein PG987_001281 [Apiospora arundinis]